MIDPLYISIGAYGIATLIVVFCIAYFWTHHRRTMSVSARCLANHMIDSTPGLGGRDIDRS